MKREGNYTANTWLSLQAIAEIISFFELKGLEPPSTMSGVIAKSLDILAAALKRENPELTPVDTLAEAEAFLKTRGYKLSPNRVTRRRELLLKGLQLSDLAEEVGISDLDIRKALEVYKDA